MTIKQNNEIPEGAEKVFDGIIFDVYHWEQKMFDGSTETFEKLKRVDTVNVIAMVGDKIILQEQEQPGEKFLSLPGGRCGKDEDHMEAMKREFLEETGYASKDIFFWKENQPFSKIVWKVKYYIARDCYFVQEPKLDAGEKIKTRFITFDELLELSENENFDDSFMRYYLLRLRLHSEEKEKFKKLLFQK